MIQNLSLLDHPVNLLSIPNVFQRIRIRDNTPLLELMKQYLPLKLEHELEPKLYLPCTSRCGRNAPEISNRVPTGITEDALHRYVKIRVIEHIEKLGLELQEEPFGD